MGISADAAASVTSNHIFNNAFAINVGNNCASSIHRSGFDDIYGYLISGDWKTLGVIAKADGTIHGVVREQNPGAKPPILHTIRRSADEVVLIYGSARKMCAFAIGIARGVAMHFNETLEITQAKCMH